MDFNFSSTPSSGKFIFAPPTSTAHKSISSTTPTSSTITSSTQNLSKASSKPQPHPLSIPRIIKSIIPYLSTQEIKEFQRINKQWRMVIKTERDDLVFLQSRRKEGNLENRKSGLIGKKKSRNGRAGWKNQLEGSTRQGWRELHFFSPGVFSASTENLNSTSSPWNDTPAPTSYQKPKSNIASVITIVRVILHHLPPLEVRNAQDVCSLWKSILQERSFDKYFFRLDNFRKTKAFQPLPCSEWLINPALEFPLQDTRGIFRFAKQFTPGSLEESAVWPPVKKLRIYSTSNWITKVDYISRRDGVKVKDVMIQGLKVLSTEVWWDQMKWTITYKAGEMELGLCSSKEMSEEVRLSIPVGLSNRIQVVLAHRVSMSRNTCIVMDMWDMMCTRV